MLFFSELSLFFFIFSSFLFHYRGIKYKEGLAEGEKRERVRAEKREKQLVEKAQKKEKQLVEKAKAEKIETARKLLTMGLSMSQVAEATGLLFEEIKKL